MRFSDNDERTDFVNDYTNRANGWYLWGNDPSIERRFWRFDLTSQISIIVEEELLYFAFPKRHEEWVPKNWYITDKRIAQYACGDQKPHFGNYLANRSMALEYLKKWDRGDL